MPRRSDLVVVGARRAELAVYLDVLRDWSALGLVADVVVVDTEVEPELQGSPCLVVSGGRQRTALLQAELARRTAITTAHVVCLSHVGEDFSTVGPERALALRHEVRNALPGAEVTGIHFIGVARPERTALVAPEALAWLGSHNVVLAPENAQSPRGGVAPIVGGPASPVTHTHLAAGLCAAVGLWAADRQAPFHGEPDVGGDQVVALRTYTRHLSARSVESQLAEQVVDVHRGYPVPLDDGMPAQRLEDEAGAARAMADHLLARHPYVMAGERVRPAVAPPSPIGFLAALGMTLRFQVSALAGAPTAFANGLVQGVAHRLAATTQALAFGNESAYVLSARGIRGIQQDGSLATPEELDGEFARLLGQLGGEGGAMPAEHPDLTGLWTDFVHGGLTLLDGAKRVEGLEPVRIGSGLGVVSSPQVVVPDPRQAFELDPDISGYAKTTEIAPYDVDAARRTYEVLGEQAGEHRQVSGLLAQEQNRLRGWFTQVEQTYAGRVGELLYGELRTTRDEVVSHARELAEARSPQDVPQDVLAAQGALSQLLLKVAGTAGVVVLLLLALAGLGMVGWVVAAPLVVVVLLAWLVAGTVLFRRAQQPLFDLVHRREAVAGRLGGVKEALAEALADLRRIQRTYRQYLDWARAFGTFVQAPLGRHRAQEDRDVVLGAGYPHNHRFGTALPDPESVELVAARLRPQLFPVGWTSGPWDAFVADLPAIGGDTHFLQDEPSLIYTDRAVSTRSILSQWSEAVAARDWTGGYAQLVDRLHRSLGHQADAHRQALLGRVRTLTIEGTPATETYEQFMGGLQADPGAGAFSRALFADVPESHDPWRVRDALVTDSEEFSSSMVLTQLSAGFSPRDLAFVERHARAAAPAHDSGLDAGQAPHV